MSELKVTTLSNQSGVTVPVDTVISGTAKAWVNFNGTGTVAIRASFNVSSITDVTTGTYTVNFTTAMADVNYAVMAGNGNNTSDNKSANITNISSSASVSIIHYENSAVQDVAQLFVSIFR
jgi:hypothetical protein